MPPADAGGEKEDGGRGAVGRDGGGGDVEGDAAQPFSRCAFGGFAVAGRAWAPTLLPALSGLLHGADSISVRACPWQDAPELAALCTVRSGAGSACVLGVDCGLWMRKPLANAPCEQVPRRRSIKSRNCFSVMRRALSWHV